MTILERLQNLNPELKLYSVRDAAFKKYGRLIEDYEGRNYPTPLDTSNQDLVWVGRVRRDLTDDNALTLWCCGDQIRKGAASNAVQILKRMIES